MQLWNDPKTKKNYLLHTEVPAAAKASLSRVAKLRPHHKLWALPVLAIAAIAALVPPIIYVEFKNNYQDLNSIVIKDWAFGDMYHIIA